MNIEFWLVSMVLRGKDSLSLVKKHNKGFRKSENQCQKADTRRFRTGKYMTKKIGEDCLKWEIR
jgi:hypothetical protein